MGRKAVKKGDATRGRILDEAARQAGVRGLAAVSLNDVAEAVGLSKSGLFKHFQSKEAMQQALLSATLDRIVAMIWTPTADIADPHERLARVFELSLDWEEFACGEGGCLINTATIEFDDQPGALRDLLRESQVRLNRGLKSLLRGLSDPPPPEEAVIQAAFELKSYMLGFGEARRIFGNDRARSKARQAFQGTVDRLLQ